MFQILFNTNARKINTYNVNPNEQLKTKEILPVILS